VPVAAFAVIVWVSFKPVGLTEPESFSLYAPSRHYLALLLVLRRKSNIS
jgi:hypothetical protein